MMVRRTCWATRGSTPSSLATVGDAGEHGVLPASVDHRHVVLTLVAHHASYQSGPFRQEGHQAAVHVVDLVPDSRQVELLAFHAVHLASSTGRRSVVPLCPAAAKGRWTRAARRFLAVRPGSNMRSESN